MSLINYVEPINPGNIFVGIGALIISIVAALIFYRFYLKICQWFDLLINKEAKYSIIEEDCLQKIADKKGINLDAELRKINMLRSPSKNFRRKIEDQVFDEMFPEQKTDKAKV